MRKHVRNYTDRFVSFLRTNAVFLAILAGGVLLRILFIQFQGLSNDELSAWYRTRFNTWDSFWYFGVKAGDMHPAGYQVLLHFWLNVFGSSEWAIRSLSLLFYIANSFLIQRLSERFFTRSSGWMVNALYSSLTFMVINTTFSRPYNSGVFFLLCAFYLVLSIQQSSKRSVKKILLLTIALAGAMLSHYFAFLVAGMIGIVALVHLKGRSRTDIIISGILSVCLFLPHLSVTMYQLNRGGLGWLAPPEAGWLPYFFLQWFNFSFLVAGVFLFLLIIWMWKADKIQWSKAASMGLTIVGGSILLGYLVSYLFTPIMRELVMLYVLPFLLLPLFSLFTFKEKKFIPIFSIFSVLVGFGIHSVFIQRLFQPIHFGVFRELGKEINAYDRKFGEGEIEYALNTNNVNYLNYYLEHPKKEEIVDWFQPKTFDQLQERLENSDAKYVCYTFNNQYELPQYRELIRQYYPVKMAEFSSPGAAVYLFKKGHRLWLNPCILSSDVRMVETQEEFSNEFRIKVAELKQFENLDYYVLKCDLSQSDKGELYSVVCLVRDGKMIENEGIPLYYQTIDQSKLMEPNTTRQITMPFVLPKNASAGDEILFYIWNPKKGKIRYSKPSLFEVH